MTRKKLIKKNEIILYDKKVNLCLKNDWHKSGFVTAECCNKYFVLYVERVKDRGAKEES